MSNRKLYMLKVACARLHDLKVQERRYKGALVKRACMHLLIKQGAYKDPRLGDNAIPYDLLRDTSDIDAKVDWKSGFWGTALGKFLRPYFENGEHESAYIKRLSKFRNMPDVARRMAQMKELSDMGVDPSKWESIIAETDRFTSGYAAAEKAHHDSETASRQKAWEANREELKRQLAESDKEGREGGWLKSDKREGGNPYSYYGFGGPFRRSGYLTDLQAKYDPDFAREYGLGGGTVINNYYYGPDGKRHEVPPAAGTSPDPSRPGATTPGPDPNPDLPGLSTVLGTSGPDAQYVSGLSSLSGMTLDPKRLSMTTPGDPLSTPGLPSGLGTYSSDPVVSGGSFGSTSLTTTGDPTVDLGKGSITWDPASLPPINYLATPATPVESSSTINLIDKGGQIVGDIAGILPGGKETVDQGTDWMKTKFNNLSPEIRGVIDTGVTALGDLNGPPKTSDPSSPFYMPK